MSGYDDTNIFAKILRGEIPCAKILEDTSTLSFMDAFPQSNGHCLVIPRVKACDLFDCPPDVLAGLIQVTQRVAAAVDKALKPDGVRVVQYNRTPAGQSVFHIHFHVIPIYEDVPLLGHAAYDSMADFQDLQSTAAKIRTAL